MKNHLVVAFLHVATFVSCLLPFREINTIAGTYSTLFGTGTAQASVKFDSGVDLKIPLLSIVFILVSYAFLKFEAFGVENYWIGGVSFVSAFSIFSLLHCYISFGSFWSENDIRTIYWILFTLALIAFL